MIYYSSHNSKNTLTDEEEIYSSQKDGRTIKVNKDLSLNDIINIILEHLIFKEDLDYFGFEKNNLNGEIISLKVDMKEFMKQSLLQLNKFGQERIIAGTIQVQILRRWKIR